MWVSLSRLRPVAMSSECTVCGSVLMSSLSQHTLEKHSTKRDPPLASMRVGGMFQPPRFGPNIYSRFHFQVKCCITVSHLLLCTNTSTGYCYSFFYFKYLYTYLTNVLKSVTLLLNHPQASLHVFDVCVHALAGVRSQTFKCNSVHDARFWTTECFDQVDTVLPDLNAHGTRATCWCLP